MNEQDTSSLYCHPDFVVLVSHDTGYQNRLIDLSLSLPEDCDTIQLTTKQARELASLICRHCDYVESISEEGEQ